MRNLKKVLSVLLVVVMLATAMVPAFAADTYTYSAQAKTLYDLGLFKGLSSTEYVPDLGTALTREQGFALIVRLLGNDDDAAALKAADVDAALAPFGDVKDVEPTLKNTIAYAVKNGLVIGDTSKLLNAKGPMLGKDFATVLLRKLGYADTEFTYDTATVDLANKGGLDATVAAKLASKALIRDDAAGMMFAALQAKYKTGETVIAKLVASKDVDEAKAVAANVYTKPATAAVAATVVGAKKINLTFNKAVEKLETSAVTVKRGSSAYATDAVKLADDKKSAVITISNLLVKGDYEVSVTGLADAAVTAKFTAENERVEKIEFSGDSAVLESATDFDAVLVNYKILNQYNEDVTSKYYSNVDFSTSKGTVTKQDGKLTINAPAVVGGTPSLYVIGEKITVTGTYVDTENSKSVFASAVLTVSQMAQVGEITITKLYNSNNEELKLGSTYSDFKLLVDAKDQYGNKIPYRSLASALVMQSTDLSVLGLAPSFEEVVIDGVKYTALSLVEPANARAGTANIILVSKYSGKMAQLAVTVKDTQKIDTLTLSAPEFPIAGEIISIPFIAMDQDGKEITKLSGLNLNGPTKVFTVSGQVAGETPSARFETDAVTGKPVLNLDARTVRDNRTLYISGVTATYKYVNISVTLQKPAVLNAEAVRGISSSYKTNLLEGNKAEFKYDSVTLQDSYGRNVSSDKLISNYNYGTDYRFVLYSSDMTKLSVPTVAGATYAVIGTGTTSADKAARSITASVNKGSSSMKVVLQKFDNKGTAAVTDDEWKDLSETSFSMASVDKEAIQSYTVNDIKKVYYLRTPAAGWDANAQDQSVTVEGVLANGKKVSVPETITVGADVYRNFTVSTATDLAFIGGKLTAAVGALAADDDDKSANYSVTIYGYAKTENVTKTTTISTEVPKVTTSSLQATVDYSGYVADGFVKEGNNAASVNAIAASYIDTVNLTAPYAVGSVQNVAMKAVKLVDQYGKTMPNALYVSSVYVSDVRDANGVATSATTGFGRGYSMYVTFATKDGNVFGFTLTLK